MRAEPFDKLRTALVEARDVALRQAQGPLAGTKPAMWPFDKLRGH